MDNNFSGEKEKSKKEIYLLPKLPLAKNILKIIQVALKRIRGKNEKIYHVKS